MAAPHPGGENIAGMYMEGPYINLKYGPKRADLIFTDHKMNESTVLLVGIVRH